MSKGIGGIVFAVVLAGLFCHASCQSQSIDGQGESRESRGLTKPRVSAAAGDAWPCFRGPGGMGVSGAAGLPLEWDAKNNVAWKTALPGPGASSPITFGDHIYLTCYTGYFVPGAPEGNLEQPERHAIALRRDTGTIV